MINGSPVWVGADPGGARNFGLAILAGDGSVRTWCVSCADEAVDVLRKSVSEPPAGIGVDAPLWWSSGRSGDRRADQWLRKTYHLTGGQVRAVNCLRGAALVQGMMFVQRVRELFPSVPVTETHPKAVLKALKVGNWAAFALMHDLSVEISNMTEHERDAVISAVAAREGFEGRWPLDLSANRHASEQDPKPYWLSPVHYFWPPTNT